MADITDSVDAMRCRRNLESVFPHLVEYGQSHEQFPTSSTGELDLPAVYDALRVSKTERSLCPNNGQLDCYVFRRGLKPKDLIPDWQTEIPWTIIAMDKMSNHPITDGSFSGQFRVNALFSCDAASVSMILTLDEYEMLERKLENGELFDNTILADTN